MRAPSVSLAIVFVAAAPGLGLPPVAAAESAPEPDAAPSAIRIRGRSMYTWYEEAERRVILVIGGFTVEADAERIEAHDGVVWFDEAEARGTGRVTLGVYAETDVRHHQADGRIERYDSAYFVQEGGPELSLHPEQPLGGRSDASPLYLRARMRQREYERRGAEPPREVIPAPEPEAGPPAPGVREAPVPREVTVVPRGDPAQVQFSSAVEDGVRVGIWTGGILVVSGDLEMAADSLVIWTPEQEEDERGEAEEPPLAGALRAAQAYLEGDVQINQGRRELFCDQAYYDFQRRQALAINTKIKTWSRTRDIPVYYYAREVRQLAEGVFLGKDAWMTTDEFGVPNYDMGAGEIMLVDLTPEPGEEEARPEARRVRFSAEDVRFRVRRVPLAYWPRLAGDLAEGETALRTVRLQHGSNRGTGLVTQWHLLKLLGLEREPEGFNIYLNADVWSERGPGTGIEATYAREDFFGRFLSYYLRDMGKDSVGSTDIEPSSDHRGRVRWQHRHDLPRNWEMTLELSYLSDPNFLNEFYEEEDEEAKTQESLFYLKRQSTDAAGLPTEQALTILGSWRLNDFQTQTEFLPQVGYNIIGHSLLGDRLTYFQDSEAAYVRFRPDDRLGLRGSHGELVADTIHEVDLPLRLGPVGIVPFGEARLTYFEENLARNDHRWRFTWRAGARASVQAWRVFRGVRHDLLDLDGLRHIMTFDVEAFTANTTVPMEDLIPYDVAEAGTPIWQGVADTGVVEVGWRQRFQTKRGPPGRRRTVDWLALDLEAFFFHNRGDIFPIAPDGKRAFNHVDFRTDWRVTDSTRLWTDTNWNTEDGTLDFFAVGATVIHSPRLSYSAGHRYVPDAGASRTFLAADYRINEKWRVTFLEQFDFNDMRNAQSHLILTRRMNRWLVRVRLEADRGEDETFVGLEFQPLGVPEVRVGF